jgi:hypothetical protein
MKILIIVSFFLLALGLASAGPRKSLPNFFKALDAPGKKQSNAVATDQIVIPPEVILGIAKAAPKVIAGVIKFLKLVVCDNTDSAQLQVFANNEERDANVMALVKVMHSVLAAEEKLDEIKQLSMKGNLVAETELFDWVDSVKSKLKGTFRKIGSATKMLLCK